MHPVVVTCPSCGYPASNVGVPQLSSAVGSTNAGTTLHSVPVMAAVPVTVGGTSSWVQEIVCTNGRLSLPHASTNIHVRVCELMQPVVVTCPSCGYPASSVGVPQLSSAVGSTNAGTTLHSVPVMAAVPVTVGGTSSCVHEIVCTNGALSLPHASTNIHVRVCARSDEWR